jgi:hypothetical protein
MTDNRRLLAGALGLTIVLAACGGSTGSSASGATPTQAPAATENAGGGEATEAPEATEEGGGEATEAPTANPDATEDPFALTGLASTLPEKVKGVTYQRTGFDGDQLGMMGGAAGLSEEDLGKILKDNGKTISDLNLAVAAPADSSASGAMLYALQIEGVPAEKWMPAMGSGFDLTKSQTIAGKKVYGDMSTAFGVAVYPVNDTVYMMLLVDQAAAEDILSQLP